MLRIIGWSTLISLTAVVYFNLRRIRRLEAQLDQLAEVADTLRRTRHPDRRRRHLKLLGIPAAVVAADHLAAKTAVAAAVAVGTLAAGTALNREGSRPLDRTPPAAAEQARHAWRTVPTTTTATVGAGTGRTPSPVGLAPPAESTSPGTTPRRSSPTTTVPAATTTTVAPATTTTIEATILEDDSGCVTEIQAGRLLGLDVCVPGPPGP